MQKITLFLASSAELKPEWDQLEIEIYRKCKSWHDRGIFLHLDIWEDLSARMIEGGLQSEYNLKALSNDIFILLAYIKVGMYTAEEFIKTQGQFKSTKKPFIFTYFKKPNGIPTDPSLEEFHQKLKDLKHYYSSFTDSNDLWTQFNKELDRLEIGKFQKFKHSGDRKINNIDGKGNILITKIKKSEVNISIGNTTNQTAK